MKLSPKSQAILDRFYVFRDRCKAIEVQLGEPAAKAYHLRFKGNPGCDEAAEEFERLLSAKFN
jgi:hypothetical protein